MVLTNLIFNSLISNFIFSYYFINYFPILYCWLKKDKFMRLRKKKNVGIFIFDLVEVLDFSGPYEVFSSTRLTKKSSALIQTPSLKGFQN